MKPQHAFRLTPTSNPGSVFINVLKKNNKNHWINARTEGMKAQPLYLDKTTTVYEIMQQLGIADEYFGDS